MDELTAKLNELEHLIGLLRFTMQEVCQKLKH